MLVSIDCNFPSVKAYVLVSWRNSNNADQLLGVRILRSKNEDELVSETIIISGLGKSVYVIDFFESKDGNTPELLLCQLSIDTTNGDSPRSLKAERF